MAMKRLRFEPGGKHAKRRKRTVREMPQPSKINESVDVDSGADAAVEVGGLHISKNIYKVILVLIIAAVVLVVMENREDLTLGNIGNWIRTKAVGLGFGDGYPTELTGSTADPGNFGSSEGNMYVVSDTSLTVMNSSAKELFSARHSYNDPAVAENGGRYLLYNVGGTGYQVVTASGMEIEATAESDITTAAMAQSGKFALALQPADYAAELCVFMKDGTKQYSYKFADTYITAIALNSDGTRGAAASVTSKSGAIVSRITVFDFSEEEPTAVYECSGNMIIGLLWSNDNRVIAVGDTQTLVSDTKFNFEAYDYGGREVTALCMTNNRAIVSVSNYAYGGSSTLLVFEKRVTPLEIELPGRAGWITSTGHKTAVLLPDMVISADLSTGRLEGECDISADTKGIAMADESMVYLLGVHEVRKENLKVIRNTEELFQAN